MKMHLKEFLAAAVLIPSLIGLPIVVFQNAPWVAEDGARVVHLTAVTKYGVWTDEKVDGLTYWHKEYKAAQIKIRINEKIILRLSSSDVTHTFYVPELNLGPIRVDAGHTVEVLFQADTVGEFIYYCTTVCGECHFYMQGKISVFDSDKNIPIYAESISNTDNKQCGLHHTNEAPASFIDRGKYLFEKKGCITCHGENGKGGIYNPNYVSTYVPQLDNLADKLKIYWEEDADTIIALLESNADFEKLENDPPIDNYNRFLAQHESILNKINDGGPDLQQINPDGPQPPLFMPAWDEHLSKQDVNAILAYLINQYNWEEYE